MAAQESTAAILAMQSYRRWQTREENADHLELADWQDKVIANGDPECDELIAALEAGWLKDAGR